MTETRADSSEFLPVTEAAETTGIPPRTIYRWIKARAVPSRREGDAVLVDVTAVRRCAARRGGNAPAPAGAPADNGKVAPVAGDLAGHVFGLFDEGISAVEVVRRERVAPSVVAALFREYSSLKETVPNGRPSLANRLDGLESKWKERFENLCTFASDLEQRVNGLREKMARHLRDNICPSCHAIGALATPAICRNCGAEWEYRQ